MATSLYFSYLTHHSTVTRLGLPIDFPFAFVEDEDNNHGHQLWFSEFNPDTGYSGRSHVSSWQRGIRRKRSGFRPKAAYRCMQDAEYVFKLQKSCISTSLPCCFSHS